MFVKWEHFVPFLYAMTNNRLPHWINQKLQERGWSQNQLAREAGLTKSQVSRIVNEKTPSNHEAHSLGRALNVPPETIMRLAGQLPPSPNHNDKSDEMMQIFSGLADDDQDEILQMGRLKLERHKRGKQRTERVKG